MLIFIYGVQGILWSVMALTDVGDKKENTV